MTPILGRRDAHLHRPAQMSAPQDHENIQKWEYSAVQLNAKPLCLSAMFICSKSSSMPAVQSSKGNCRCATSASLQYQGQVRGSVTGRG